MTREATYCARDVVRDGRLFGDDKFLGQELIPIFALPGNSVVLERVVRLLGKPDGGLHAVRDGNIRGSGSRKRAIIRATRDPKQETR